MDCHVRKRSGMRDTRNVLTLFGTVAVTFNDEGPNTLAGDPAALRELDAALRRAVNRWGIGVTALAMNPDDLEFIADTPSAGIGLFPADDPYPSESDPPPPPEETPASTPVTTTPGAPT